MKYICYILLIFTYSGIMNGQNNNHLNCIVFLDGKLISGKGCFEYKIQENKFDTIKFKYVIGEIQIDNSSFKLLKSLESKDSLSICINYTNFDNCTFSYKKKIDFPEIFFQDYVVLRITNLNVKRKKYYFGLSTPSIISPFISREYNMFFEYDR